MCNAKAEGGQRCHSHAKEQYDRALRNLRLGTPAAAEAFLAAEIEYASTPQGEANLAEQRDAAIAAGDVEVAAGLDRAIARGRDLRERNTAVKGAVKDATKARDEAALLATLPPTDIDTRLAELYGKQMENQQHLARAVERVHYDAGDRKVGSWGRQQWQMTLDEAIQGCQDKVSLGGHLGAAPKRSLAALAAARKEATKIAAAMEPLNAEFTRRGGWNRAFLVDNQNGHVHKDMSCSTCEPTTRYSWQTQYSGMDESTIVEAAGEKCCTRCYPSAPAEVLNRPTRMVSESQAAAAAAREERAAAKVARDRAKIEKALTADGSKFTITYGPGRYERERFKTESTATSWIVEKIVDFGPGGWRSRNGATMDPQMATAIQQIKDAIATKHGWTPTQVEEHLAKKVKAKRKRDGVT